MKTECAPATKKNEILRMNKKEKQWLLEKLRRLDNSIQEYLIDEGKYWKLEIQKIKNQLKQNI